MRRSRCELLDRLCVADSADCRGLWVRRAWTKADGGLSLELIDEAGVVRHARWDAGTGLGFARAGRDRKLPALEGLLARAGAELVTHRPGRRAVVRLVDGGEVCYGRALRPRRVGEIARALKWLGGEDVGLFEGAGPVEVDEGAGLIVARGLPGESMEAMASACPVRYIDAALRLGEELGRLEVIPPAWLGEHSARDEAELVTAKAAELERFVPEVAAAARGLLGGVVARLRAGEGAQGLVHRDLYDRQVLADASGAVRVIDLDTVARGERALDAGNMVAHFELRGLLEPQLRRVMERACLAFLEGLALPGSERPRVAAYADSARLRLGMLFALRPAEAWVAPRLLGLVGSGLPEAAPIGRAVATRGEPPHFFVVGCPRSGTTMLERMLDAHGDVAVAHETHWVTRFSRRKRGLGPNGEVTRELLDGLFEERRFVRVAPSRDEVEGWLAGGPMGYGEFVSRVYGRFGGAMGAGVVGDKSTGGYIRDLERLHGVCPGAAIVHLVRDGRDVCLSMLGWAKAGRAAGRFAMWRDDPVATTAAWWRWQVLAAREAGERLGGSVYREIRYEDLVSDPESGCRAVCGAIGIEYSPAMVEFASGRTSGVGSANKSWLPPTPGVRDWRRDMSARDAELFEAIAGDALELFGYERRHGGPSGEIAALARERAARWEAELRGGERPSGRVEIVTPAGVVPAGGES